MSSARGDALPTRERGAVHLTELGLGGAPLGNLYRAISDETAHATVMTAWNHGIRYIDTAPHYGLGLSERRLGQVLKTLPRDELVLSTKVGRRLIPSPEGASRRDDEGFDVPATLRRTWDFSRDGIRRSLDESLERLGVHHVDIAYLHDPEGHWEQALREALPALIELRDEGVVRAVGAGMNLSAPLLELVRSYDVDVVMCAGRHTLLEQADELLDAALEHHVSVVAAGVYNSGILAHPRPHADATYNYGPVPDDVLDKATQIAEVCEWHGVTLPEAAIAFPLRHPAVASVVIGASRPDEASVAVARYETPVPENLWSDLTACGLLQLPA